MCNTDVDECSAGLSRCDKKATCTNTLGSYICSCNKGYKGNGFTCRENRLFDYKDDIRVTLRVSDFTSPLIDIPIGFPFDTVFYYSLYFTDNGVVVFQRYSYDNMYTFSYPSRFQASMPPMIAAFWADADLSTGYGEMYYQVYDFQASPNSNQGFKSSLESAISTSFTSLDTKFKALWAIKITWEKVPPYPAIYFSPAQTNTYQVILATDGLYSFCLILFDDGGMNWNYYALPSSYRPKMGYFSGVSRYSNVEGFPAFNDPQTEPYVSIQQIYRPDQYIGRNTGQKGRWAYRLERNNRNTENPRQKCLIWYYNQPEPYQQWAFSAPPCPCTHGQARFDSSFAAGDMISHYGFEQKTTNYISMQSASPSWNGAGTRCYYSWNGALVYGEKERYLPTPWRYARRWSNRWNPWASLDLWSNIGPLREQYRVNEVDPYNSCCRDSGSSSFCGLYHSRRPLDFCWGYSPPRIGMFFGDPHINSLDDVLYTFNGLGEFILLNVKDKNNTVIFRLQGRTARAGNGTSYATIFVGLAAAIDNGTQLFQVEWSIVGENSSAVVVDGNAFDVTDNATYIGKVMLQKIENNEIQASFDGGISVTISARVGALNFIVSLNPSYQNQTEGLMGVYNGDKRDDLMAANGELLESDGKNPPNASQIFQMGMTWKTTPNNSIFQYNSTTGESWYTYNNNSFVPKFYDELLRTTDSAMLRKANDSCGGNEECVFDILSTGDFAVGEATLESSDSFKMQSSSMENFPPNITGPSLISTKLNEPVTIQYVATDPNNDIVIFSLDTNSSDIRITGNGTLTWNPTSSSPLRAIVRANDSKVTQELFLSLVLCNCSNNATCLFNRTSSTGNSTDFMVAGCNCTAAWSGQYCSEDFDACVQNNCYDNGTCTDHPAPGEGLTCGPCPAGLTGNGMKCSDIDECYENKSECQQICFNTLQGYNCSCEAGFRVNSLNSSLCDDIDECSESSPCVENTNCINNPGSYVCECKAGYAGNASLFCADINECANTNSTVCPDTSLCINTNGSYQCECFPGFNASNCTDVNECQADVPVCPLNSKCLNTVGSFTCRCDSGYEGEKCSDIDECAQLDSCSTVADCTNTNGSFFCTCRSGYRGNGTHCEDINECLNSSLCSASENCQNTNGGFVCSCKSGYLPLNGSCQDEDECAASEHVCSPFAEDCANIPGSFECHCKAGYRKVNGTCEDINECPIPEMNNCSKTHGICSNIAGSYGCLCIEGYTGDGETCTDINECLHSLCSGNGTCKNLPGSYECECHPGYELDGTKQKCIGSRTTPAPSCAGMTCSPTYCSNGGNCSLTEACELICQCPEPFKDKTCELAGNSFMPQLLHDIPRRTIQLLFNSTGNQTVKMEDVNSSVALTMQRLPVKAFQTNSNITVNATGGSLISEFNYSGNITVITFLNERLIPAVKQAFKAERFSRSMPTVNLKLLKVEDVVLLPVDKLKDYFTCDSIGYRGYVLNTTSFVCESLCANYCQNGGVCSHTKAGPVCSCVAFSMYIPFGDRCQDLSINLGAFFGILFGALAFLFLLMLAIILTVYCCKRRASLLKTDFYWKVSSFKPFSKVEEKSVWSTSSATEPTLTSWKPQLDKVNPSLQCKIKRPYLKTGAGITET
uniref:Mucin-4 isoform X2 n=1 Tax=Geotrypetes seraphini TaxID=260995 RepID=A0A6P8SG54_GEOSA|nr:mucin-4 isoform X2 [Geotrypetes seraphini]